MGVAVLIPARYASTRYPGKPLAQLRGATGEAKTLVRRSWDAAMAVPGVDLVAVCTDDDRIAEHARGFGAAVIMTAEIARNGSERCAEAAASLPDSIDLVVNLQGDAPLTPPDFVTALIDAMAARPDIDVATPVLRCDAETLRHFREDRRAGRVGGTTAVFAQDRRALYFSKEVLPYADAIPDEEAGSVFHHVGLYAYRRAALTAYAGFAPTPLEQREGLEQLRFLENGAPLLCVEVAAGDRVFWELNNPVDIDRIEAAMARMGLA